MDCPECGKEMNQIDSTYCNTKTDRAEIGEHTGNVYECVDCERIFLDNFLNGKLHEWNYW